MTDQRNSKLFASMFPLEDDDDTPPPLGAATVQTPRNPLPRRTGGGSVATPTGGARTRPASANKAPRLLAPQPPPRVDPLANMPYEEEDDDDESSSSSEDIVSSDDDDAMACAQREDDGIISVEGDDDEEEEAGTPMRVETPRATTAVSARSNERDAELSKRESALESRAAKLDQRARELDARDVKLDQRTLEQEKKEGEMKKLQHTLRQANEKQRELYTQNTATLALLDERINRVEELEKRAAQQPQAVPHTNGAASPSPVLPHMVHLTGATQGDYEAMIPKDVRDAMWLAHAMQKTQFDTTLYRVEDGMPGVLQCVMVIDSATRRIVYSQTRCNQL